jgi:hypothetical protein
VDEWSADWSDLGANSRQDFQTQCVDDMDTLEASLERREWQEVRDDCQQVANTVGELDCDALRALYLD